MSSCCEVCDTVKLGLLNAYQIIGECGPVPSHDRVARHTRTIALGAPVIAREDPQVHGFEGTPLGVEANRTLRISREHLLPCVDFYGMGVSRAAVRIDQDGR